MAELVQSDALTYTIIEGCEEFCFATLTSIAASGTIIIRVTITTDTKWINATELTKNYPCKTGAPKQFNYWSKTMSAKKVMGKINTKYNITKCYRAVACRLFSKVRGSYVHPDLLINLVTWYASDHSHLILRLAALLQQAVPITIVPTLLAPVPQQALSIQDAINIIAANTIDITTDPKDQNMIMIINTHGIIVEEGSSIATAFWL